MAPRVGQALSEARMQRGLALNDVERITGIRVQQLRALEEERWEALPGDAETREALSGYSQFLGLDDEPLLEEYEGRPRRPGGSRSSSSRRIVVMGAAVAVALLLGVVLVVALGSGGGENDEKQAASAEGNRGEEPTVSERAQSTTGATEVSLRLSATAEVWVCLVGVDGSPVVDGQTLTADEARGPFTDRGFELTLGNGSIELTANGEPIEVPPLAEPLGLRVTPDGAKRLAPGAGPTCS